MTSLKGTLPDLLRRGIRRLRKFPSQLWLDVQQKFETALWLRTRHRPRFNTETLALRFPEVACPEDGTIVGERLLVHVAFHYVPNRLKYLKETLDAVREFPFRTIDISVDTNSEDFAKLASEFFGNVNVTVWTDLEHPFKLTWAHRRAMSEQSSDYDTFAYLEDDIGIPSFTIRRWLTETVNLAPHGAISGFLRVEQDRYGKIILSDFRAPISRENIVELDGRLYLDSPYPHQACWIYHKPIFDDFMTRESFMNGSTYPEHLVARDSPLGVREQISTGFSFDDIPLGRNSKVLIPLNSDGSVAPDTLIAHLPSNYGMRRVPHPAGLGTVTLENVFED